VVGTDGIALAVHERGPADAPTVLLVHGYPDDHAVWDLVAERLAADHHVVAYDVRGAGTSGVPASRHGYRMAALAADVATVAAAVSPDRPVHLVAHDWGSIQSWAAVTDPVLAPSFASFTSLSGPSLAHVGPWLRRRRRPGAGRWRDLRRQAVRSWYIGAFQTPLAPLVWRAGLARAWPRLVARGEGAAVDARWPGPHLADDAARGVELYRANMRPGSPRAAAVPTPVPVRLVIATDDRYVTPALLDGIEALAPRLDRCPVAGGHWLPRSRPDEVARLVREHVAAVEGSV